MLRYLKLCAMVLMALLMQITLLPAYLAPPFKPNLLLIIVVYFGLRESGYWGVPFAAFLGLLADSFSGLYLGLSVFSFLSIHMLLRKAADRLYTDSGYLLVSLVFLASLGNGLLQLLLLLLFSIAGGGYIAILSGLFIQALVNALVASLVAWFMPVPLIVEDGP